MGLFKGIRRTAGWAKRTLLGDTFIRRMPPYYSIGLKTFERLTRADLAERKAFAQKRLGKVLRRAQKTKYGCRVHGDNSIETWPLLNKDTVRDNPHAFLALPMWLTVPASTSGTTGLPLKLFRSYPSIAIEQSAIDWLYYQAGLDPRSAKVAVLRGENIKPPDDLTPPFWRYDAGGRRMVMSSNHLNTQTLSAYYEALQSFQPDCLWAYPTSLDQLCRLMKERDLTLQIPLVITSSEMLGPQSHALVKEALQSHIIDYYGQAERVNFAYSLHEGEYYFLPGYSWNELIPVEEGAEGVL